MSEMWKLKTTQVVAGPEVTVHVHAQDGVLQIGLLLDVGVQQEGDYEIYAPLLETVITDDYDDDGLEKMALLFEDAARVMRMSKKR